MLIKTFKTFNESLYSMAARIAPKMFSDPATNNDYSVSKIFITFPDSTKLAFAVERETYNSDKVNYVIKNFESDRNNREAHLLRGFYMDIFGKEIQMENYQEFVFVRCWNTPADFIENDWEGYIFQGETGFHEIQMKFNVILGQGYNGVRQSNYSDSFYKNKYFDFRALVDILSNFYREAPNGIPYTQLSTLQRKFESWMVNDVDEYNPVNLFTEKIDGMSLMSIIYALHLKDNTVLDNLTKDGLLTLENLKSCPPSRVLDIFY